MMHHPVRVFGFVCLVAILWDQGRGAFPDVPAWKPEIVFPDDPFREPPFTSYETGWVKFTILTSEPATVYFQDSQRYNFHYDFATEHLEPFLGMSREQYDLVTLCGQGQQAVLGAVIMPPRRGGYPPVEQIQEYGIQFVRRDPYPREAIRDLFNLVKANVVSSPGVTMFYFPSYEQLAAAEANRDWFEAEGIPVGSTERWAEGNECYAHGWALGRLKFFAGDQIDAAYRSGDLAPGDILLTDGVPADIPIVAGIATLSPSTPNSHVAILARSWSVPFVYLREEDDVTSAQQFVGRRIILWALEDRYEPLDLRLIDVEDEIDEAMRAEILALKAPPALAIQPMTARGVYSLSTDGLIPEDIRYFGGKAANFGILRMAIPDNSPAAVAFSFDLWMDFVSQTLVGGRSLRAEIADRLSFYGYPPADMAALSADLAAIRSLFTREQITTFSVRAQDAIVNTLSDPAHGFDAYREIRFRSSTNVEDSEYFTAAGLYDSFSGCLADDLDGDASGPSLCDPSRANERGVFRAIRKVFASFYNDTAFLERLRFGVSEDQVGMALLVHHSFPDEIELANGVATVERRERRAGDFVHDVTLVTQVGAVSVANPTDGSTPEEVYIYVGSSGSLNRPDLIRSSNLVPLGGTVLGWYNEYHDLARLLLRVSDQYRAVTGKQTVVLDMEYKKVAPRGDLVIKQVREIPRAATTATVTPFLINDPAEYCIYQGEGRDVFTYHRLKSRWRFQTKNLRLTTATLQQSIYDDTRVEYAADGEVRVRRGPVSSWPGAYHRYTTGTYSWPSYVFSTVDGWRPSSLANPRTSELHTGRLVTQVSRDGNPFLTIRDLAPRPSYLTVKAKYARPVPVLAYEVGQSWLESTFTDEVWLWPRPKPSPDDIPQVRSFHDKASGTSVTTRFYWPRIQAIIKTYPLGRWDETVIEGLTREPIVLRGYFSQTYGPGHHNFSEHFLFEPGLEPGISADILAELRAKDIRLILFECTSRPRIRTFGFGADACSVGPVWRLYE